MMSSNQRDALLLIRRFAINIIKGNFDFADVSLKCKPYVVKCLDQNGFGRLVPEDYREIYEKTYGYNRLKVNVRIRLVIIHLRCVVSASSVKFWGLTPGVQAIRA